MFRRIGIFTIVALMVALLAAACGEDEPTPTPEPTATPTVDPTTVTANFRVFQSVIDQPMVEGFQEMIDRGTNGRISWTPQTFVSYDEAPDYALNRPAEYPNMLFIMEEAVALMQGIEQRFIGGRTLAPAPQGYLGMLSVGAMTYFTRDPEIKTIYDFVGKSVQLGDPGTAWEIIGRMLFEANGLIDDIDLVVGGKYAVNQLQDREVDVVTYGIGTMDTLQGLHDPAMDQLMLLTNSVYAVDIPVEAIVKLQEAFPDWHKAGVLNVGTACTGTLRAQSGADYNTVRPGTHFLGTSSWAFMIGPADDEVAYQMLKAILDNRELADDYFPFIAETWKERMGQLWMPQASFHPGAQRAYEETGTSYGIEGLREWAAQNPQKCETN